MRDVIIAHHGKEIDENRLVELFEKWAGKYRKIDDFMAIYHRARGDDSLIAEIARWELSMLSDYTLNIVDAEVAA